MSVANTSVDPLVMRYRRRKSARVLHWNPWLQDAEPGDLMVSHLGKLYRLEQNSKSAGGELYPREIKPPTGRIAEIRDGEVWWILSA